VDIFLPVLYCALNRCEAEPTLDYWYCNVSAKRHGPDRSRPIGKVGALHWGIVKDRSNLKRSAHYHLFEREVRLPQPVWKLIESCKWFGADANVEARACIYSSAMLGPMAEFCAPMANCESAAYHAVPRKQKMAGLRYR
jgi:hypothetical protein